MAGAAGVVVWGLLSWTWLIASITLLVTGIASIPALGSGMLLLVLWVLLMQGAAHLERLRAVAVHGIAIVVPARRRSDRGGLLGWLHGLWLSLTSWAFWRSTIHHHLAMIVAGVFFTLAVASLWSGWTAIDIAVRHGDLAVRGTVVPVPLLLGIGLVLLVMSVVLLHAGAIADRGLARAMISGSEEELREQVAELAERRQGAVDAAEQERLRIERDLHDGVQPRLVALAMTLGMARSAIAQDPDRAAQLLDEAHTEAKSVITDLRQLARGIHPAVLTDRGLDAALSALAARSPVPVRLRTLLGRRHDREREAVAYFVVAEALTNIAKHAAARSAVIEVRDDRDALEVRVEDDGRGGAVVHRDGVSTGLAGLADRVRAAGGRLRIDSPPGAGTVLTATIPLPVEETAS